MANLLRRKDQIIELLLYCNLVFLTLSMFFFRKSFAIMFFAFNIVMMICFFILKKYGVFFEVLSKTNKAAAGLNKTLEKLNG